VFKLSHLGFNWDLDLFEVWFHQGMIA
jgi:hypothetical protein